MLVCPYTIGMMAPVSFVVAPGIHIVILVADSAQPDHTANRLRLTKDAGMSNFAPVHLHCPFDIVQQAETSLPQCCVRPDLVHGIRYCSFPVELSIHQSRCLSPQSQ